MFYAIRTDEYDHGRTFTWAYAFTNKRTRDLVCDAFDNVEPTSARNAYAVKRNEAREAREGIASHFSYCDMRIGEYWSEEFAPLVGDAIRLGNFGPIC